MSSPLKKPFNVLDKAKAESMSDEQYETFKRGEERAKNRIRNRVKAANHANSFAFMAQFRAEAEFMGFRELYEEKHSSKLLGDLLRCQKFPRPGINWEAHHIISGSHPQALQARTILADIDILIRIDDPDNGTWMPKTKADARHTIYPNAIGHNRIHRGLYYRWIFNNIAMMTDAGLVRAFLSRVRLQLLQGNIAPEMKLQEEIDSAEYKSWLKKSAK